MISNKIDQFQGEYRFLSNFWPAEVEYEGIVYPSTEYAYQAAKTLDKLSRLAIRNAENPGIAKRMGRVATMRSDWEDVKISIMTALVRQKFFTHPELAKALMATESAELIEGNYWGDTVWGVCGGVGENHLGKILMQIRQEIYNIVLGLLPHDV